MGFAEAVPAVLVPMIVFAFIAAIVIVPMFLKSQEKARMHQTVRRLLDEGHTVSPEMLDALRSGDGVLGGSRVFGPKTELKRGLILIAVALGLVVLGLVANLGGASYSPIWPLIGVAAFPGLIGVASLIMWRLTLADEAR